MALKTLITVLAGAAALTLSVPAGFGLGDASDRSGPALAPDAFERAVVAAQRGPGAVGVYGDAVERAAAAREQARPAVTASPDAFERAALNRQRASQPVGHVDRYEADLPSGPIASPVSASGWELEWPQLGIGFGIGILLALGLVLAGRLMRFRPLAH